MPIKFLPFGVCRSAGVRGTLELRSTNLPLIRTQGQPLPASSSSFTGLLFTHVAGGSADTRETVGRERHTERVGGYGRGSGETARGQGSLQSTES